MQKFVVSKGHDAFVYYETVLEADTPEEARSLVRSVHYEGAWLPTGYVQEFDDYEIDEHSGVRLLDDGEAVGLLRRGFGFGQLEVDAEHGRGDLVRHHDDEYGDIHHSTILLRPESVAG